MMRKIISFAVILCLVAEQSAFAQGVALTGGLSYTGGYVASDRLQPVLLRAMLFDEAAGDFDIYLDTGDAKGLSVSDAAGYRKQMMTYFKIGVALPNSMFWVNLRPDAETQIIDPYLERTDMGKVMLEADLQLKKDMARFTAPDSAEGRKYWDALYAKAEQLYGDDEDAVIPTAIRPWVVPGEMIIRQSANSAYIYKAVLKVCLEQDWIGDTNSDRPLSMVPDTDRRVQELNAYSAQLIREYILPKLTAEVNSSAKYAGLRQVYYALLFAQWYKQCLACEPAVSLPKADGRNLTGLVSASAWSKRRYYESYRQSVAQGEYNVTENVRTLRGITVRQYISGGFELGNAFVPRDSAAGTAITAKDILPAVLPRGVVKVAGNDGGKKTPVYDVFGGIAYYEEDRDQYSFGGAGDTEIMPFGLLSEASEFLHEYLSTADNRDPLEVIRRCKDIGLEEGDIEYLIHAEQMEIWEYQMEEDIDWHWYDLFNPWKKAPASFSLSGELLEAYQFLDDVMHILKDGRASYLPAVLQSGFISTKDIRRSKDGGSADKLLVLQAMRDDYAARRQIIDEKKLELPGSQDAGVNTEALNLYYEEVSADIADRIDRLDRQIAELRGQASGAQDGGSSADSTVNFWKTRRDKLIGERVSILEHKKKLAENPYYKANPEALENIAFINNRLAYLESGIAVVEEMIGKLEAGRSDEGRSLDGGVSEDSVIADLIVRRSKLAGERDHVLAHKAWLAGLPYFLANPGEIENVALINKALAELERGIAGFDGMIEKRKAELDSAVGGQTETLSRDGGRRVGGIDFRSLPLRAVAVVDIGSAPPAVPADMLRMTADKLDACWAQISGSIMRGGASWDRLKDFVIACRIRKDVRRLRAAADLIARVLAMEEERSIPSSVDIKELVACLG